MKAALKYPAPERLQRVFSVGFKSASGNEIFFRAAERAINDIHHALTLYTTQKAIALLRLSVRFALARAVKRGAQPSRRKEAECYVTFITENCSKSYVRAISYIYESECRELRRKKCAILESCNINK